MANSTTIKVSTLLLFILLAHVVSSRATSYRGFEIMRKRIDSKRILHKLGYDYSNKMKDSNRRAMVDTKRVAPEGPDHQHHQSPPTSP
ncbi:CLAVATA3/ESR (CLE)-related protein 6 [Camellia lanceoleosa]|uniref:CLAVATA3/ESR (CLE)-related protein 6 n=1 Tax=Camellia lanceoleosa TaxID=1840588 RepID=A0ACC0HT92_9ERIC|nr:CLAVATA3/ESR (CLE)-related protein 6 [Camellia lanceoleosa]